MGEHGKYIVIEGTDGSGKSTQAHLITERLQTKGFEAVEFHEPDGVEIAGEIRTIIKNGSLARTALSNVLLFSVCRRENWLQKGQNILDRGGWVVSARDYSSTEVYQGYGEGIDLDLIEYLTLLTTDERYMNPDHKIILDINDEAERAQRIASRGELENPDTFESRGDDFQQKVIEGYRDIARRKNLPVISANQPLEVVTEQIWNIINR